MNSVIIEGARYRNLKNIHAVIPKNKLTVVTGISGSGKSTLVFDILFEEGRKQYLEALGLWKDISFNERFENIEGMSPVIAVRQNLIRQSNPFSTVGSKTGLLKLLARLYCLDGSIECSCCGSPVGRDLICSCCGSREEAPDPSYFSPSHPNGMCFQCGGRGELYSIHSEKLLKPGVNTLGDVFESVDITPGYRRILKKNFSDYLNTLFEELPDEVVEDVLYGHYTAGNSRNRSFSLEAAFIRLMKKGVDLQGVYELCECPGCRGNRVGEEAFCVTIRGKHIGHLGKMTLTELKEFLKTSELEFSSRGKLLVKEILGRLDNLIHIRLGHLSLYRSLPSLSGGEIQRLFINSHIRGNMSSLIYILDEPTAGLHCCEKQELLCIIRQLKDMGNTVVLVEHDPEAISMADHILDIGPHGGVHGGEVVYQGGVKGLLACRESITGSYLSRRIPVAGRKGVSGVNLRERGITIKNASAYNLKDITITLPLGRLVGIAGVSGSGKSSLISGTLVPRLKHCFQKERRGLSGIEGGDNIDSFAEVSQEPIGRRRNSHPASYTGIWDKIRSLFAREKMARERGYTPGSFSFNSEGACSHCKGSGEEITEPGGSQILIRTCSHCRGRRYSDEVLEVTFRGKNIAEILELQVSEAVELFKDYKAIASVLQILMDTGLGYVKLGQPAPSLSGGEAQRIKLAREVGRRRKGHCLYILDEPTTGLSLYDIAKLILLLDRLVAKGHSVIITEHNRELLSRCDWIAELGPEGGDNGGEIVAMGTPGELKKNPSSPTGRYLL